MLVAGLRFSSLWTQTTRPPIVHTTNSSKYDLCSQQNHNQQNVPLASLALPTHVWAIHASTRKQHSYLSHGAHPIGLTHFVNSYGVLFNGKIVLNHLHLDVFPTVSSKRSSCHSITCIHMTSWSLPKPLSKLLSFYKWQWVGKDDKAILKYVRHTYYHIKI